MAQSEKRGSLLGGAIVAIAGMLAALALVFTNASGVEEAATDAEISRLSEAGIGRTAVARALLGQLVVSAERGDPAEDLALVATQSQEAIELMSRAAAQIDETLNSPLGERLLADADELHAGVAALIDEVVASGLDETTGPTIGELVTIFDSVTDQFTEIRNQSAARLATASSDASRIAGAAQFMVAFGIPAAVMLGVLLATRRRRQRVALSIQLEQQQEVNRSKDQLIANISHELRTPLTGIYTSALAMEDSGFRETSLNEELTSIIIGQSADLSRMVEDLLVSAQAGAGRLSLKIETVNALEEIELVAAEFERDGHEVTRRCRTAMLRADPVRFRQLLRNLVSNAVRHGGPGIIVDGRPTGDRYELRVSDDGDGVPAELEERLFSPFVHQGDQPLITGSVGLGLSITRVLAEAMGGGIRYGREAGRSVFTVLLPLNAEDPADEIDPYAAQPAERLPA